MSLVRSKETTGRAISFLKAILRNIVDCHLFASEGIFEKRLSHVRIIDWTRLALSLVGWGDAFVLLVLSARDLMRRLVQYRSNIVGVSLLNLLQESRKQGVCVAKMYRGRRYHVIVIKVYC